VNKAQELIDWFEKNGNDETELYEIESELNWFDSDGYLSDTHEMEDQGRWWTSWSAVWAFEDGSFAYIGWLSPSTEMQEQPPNINITEVEPYEETVIKYRSV
jgi:hypothetical protein